MANDDEEEFFDEAEYLLENTEKALELVDLPKEGYALDLGFGLGGVTKKLAKVFPGKTIGYELNADYLNATREEFDRFQIPAELIEANVIDLCIHPQSASVIIVGMTMYMPKSEVIKLLQKAGHGLISKGVLIVYFATKNDFAMTDPFTTYTCWEEPRGSASFFHRCPDPMQCMYDHPFVKGASFWDIEEADKMLAEVLPHSKVIFTKLYEWNQKGYTDWGEVEWRPRSFYLVTLQKH